MYDDSSSASLADTLAREIDGLPTGSRIPTHRELVLRFGVSATTVSRALATLSQRGFIVSRPGAGTFRAEAHSVPAVRDTSWQEPALDAANRSERSGGDARGFHLRALMGSLSLIGPDIIDLNGGYLHPELQPTEMLSRALARVARRGDTWNRPHAAGVPELRDWFASEIGGGLGRHDILVCGAGQNALSIALRALCQPGERVAIESPTYPGTIAAAQGAGLQAVPVPVDADGLRSDYLDKALTATQARVVVVQPLFQNPTGASLTRERQREIYQIARSHGAFIVEDDFARHMAHPDAGALVPAMITDDPGGAVVHIRSLTKVTSPNLRVGALAARGPVMARLRAAHVVDTMFVPSLLQYTVLEIVTAPMWKRSLDSLSTVLLQRRKVAIAAVDACFGPAALSVRPRGGYHLWISLPAHLDGNQLSASALAHGVAITPGENYYASDGPSSNVRLSYVAAPSTSDIDTGIRHLEPLLREQ